MSPSLLDLAAASLLGGCGADLSAGPAPEAEALAAFAPPLPAPHHVLSPSSAGEGDDDEDDEEEEDEEEEGGASLPRGVEPAVRGGLGGSGAERAPLRLGSSDTDSDLLPWSPAAVALTVPPSGGGGGAGTAPVLPDGSKLKASNCHCLSIAIGGWRRESRYEGDLVSKVNKRTPRITHIPSQKGGGGAVCNNTPVPCCSDHVAVLLSSCWREPPMASGTHFRPSALTSDHLTTRPTTRSGSWCGRSSRTGSRARCVWRSTQCPNRHRTVHHAMQSLEGSLTRSRAGCSIRRAPCVAHLTVITPHCNHPGVVSRSSRWVRHIASAHRVAFPSLALDYSGGTFSTPVPCLTLFSACPALERYGRKETYFQ